MTPASAITRIGLFATGGTIAMQPDEHGEGAVPHFGASTIAATAPDQAGVVLEPRDLFRKPSASITLHDVGLVAAAVRKGFEEGLAGIVITHGTDTIEETAFALSLLLDVPGPVVLTGAMRNPEAAGADGPANLADAIRVAASSLAVGHGPMLVMNAEIHAAHLVRKVHSSRVDAFSSEPYGPLGRVVEAQVQFEMRAIRRPPALKLGKTVPVVPIIEVGMDLEPETIEALARADIDGLVIAGVGGGHVSARSAGAIGRLAGQMPVVLTSRVGMGGALRASYAYEGSEIDLAHRGLLNGGRWQPAQARLLLQLALSSGMERPRLASLFL